LEPSGGIWPSFLSVDLASDFPAEGARASSAFLWR
jgi:hypothetical protein